MPDVILAFYTNKRVFFSKADTSLAVNAEWICYYLRLVYTGFIKLLTSGRLGTNPGLSTQPHSSVNMLIIWALHHWDLLWSPSTHGNVCPVLRLLVEITARPPGGGGQLHHGETPPYGGSSINPGCLKGSWLEHQAKASTVSLDPLSSLRMCWNSFHSSCCQIRERWV